jgi:hypothetical protein
MTDTRDRLYELLPAIYRIRDDAESLQPQERHALKGLLAVIGEQVTVLEDNLAQLYDDHFIETCSEWVVPYIADLVGVRGLAADGVVSGRAEVANTLAYRRRKGTAAVLEQLARDVTGWDSSAVEYFLLLATTQYMNHLRPENIAWADLRRWEALERVGTPFDSLAHTADVRRIATGRGRYNIPNVGIYLWRLRSYALTDSPAVGLDANRYFFNPLGSNTPLVTLPVTEREITHLAEPINVPMPIGRRILERYLAAYYGPGKSVSVSVNGVAVDAKEIMICDLSDVGTGTAWAHTPVAKTAIDPILGRIALPGAPAVDTHVRVTFHYAFGADMGGGEYRQPEENGTPGRVESVPNPHATIEDAVTALAGRDGTVRITDSGRYEWTPVVPAIALAPGQQLHLRAGDKRRPAIVLGGELVITGTAGDKDAEIALSGLLVAGATIRVTGGVRAIRLRHCTLVPGLHLSADGQPQQPAAPSLIVESPQTTVVMEWCILGALRIAGEAKETHIRDSVVDATAEDGVAYAALDGDGPGAPIDIADSTIIGKVHTRVVRIASNTIFLARRAAADGWPAPVRVSRLQEGCVRFSYLPPSSQVPRPHRCQPALPTDEDRVRPQFTSLRYGDAGYAQLSRFCAAEIRQGADDESEMGAFHSLFQPQREAALRQRLDEYLRFGLEAGIQ